jgi:hypothetical protein
MAGLGHQERFQARSLRDRCVLRERTFAGTTANGRDAPKADTVRHGIPGGSWVEGR